MTEVALNIRLQGEEVLEYLRRDGKMAFEVGMIPGNVEDVLIGMIAIT